MTRDAEVKLREALEAIAEAAEDIRQMGFFELRREFPAILGRLRRSVVAAVVAMRRSEDS